MTGEPDRSRGPATPAQLLVYGFAPGAEFEGQLVGAIERIEHGGTLRVPARDRSWSCLSRRGQAQTHSRPI